jgi:hypothetical protein
MIYYRSKSNAQRYIIVPMAICIALRHLPEQRYTHLPDNHGRRCNRQSETLKRNCNDGGRTKPMSKSKRKTTGGPQCYRHNKQLSYRRWYLLRRMEWQRRREMKG